MWKRILLWFAHFTTAAGSWVRRHSTAVNKRLRSKQAISVSRKQDSTTKHEHYQSAQQVYTAAEGGELKVANSE